MRCMNNADDFQIAKAQPQCVCCLAFALLFFQFQSGVAYKKACSHFHLFIFITLVRPNSADSGILIMLTSSEINETE